MQGDGERFDEAVLLALPDPERVAVSDAVINETLDLLESWLVRRMLVRAASKSYNQVIPVLLAASCGKITDNTAKRTKDYRD